jgi:hypothetical protein
MRALVLILLLANALFFGWSRGWLDSITGLSADGDREPQRIAQQLHPERVQLLGHEAVAALQKTACVELGPFADPTAAQSLLSRAGVPASSYAPRVETVPGVWAVATIRLTSKDFQARKEETYKKLHISFEYLEGHPDEEPSMILSRHPSEKAAQAALASLEGRALKGLRVLMLQPAGQRSNLAFAHADGLLQARLRNLRDTTLAGSLHDCPVTTNSATAAGAAAASSPASGPAARAG